MKAFLWHEVDTVSDEYHEGGSVLIEAVDVDRARKLGTGMTIEKEPDLVLTSDSEFEKVWVFKDAGCC